MRTMSKKALKFAQIAVIASVAQFAVGMGAMIGANLTYSHEYFDLNMGVHSAGTTLVTYSIPGLIIHKIERKMNSVTASDYTSVDLYNY